MKTKRVFTGGKKTPGAPFQGELMICWRCGKQQRSNPKKESGWTLVQLDSQDIYICPECWGVVAH